MGRLFRGEGTACRAPTQGWWVRDRAGRALLECRMCIPVRDGNGWGRRTQGGTTFTLGWYVEHLGCSRRRSAADDPSTGQWGYTVQRLCLGPRAYRPFSPSSRAPLPVLRIGFRDSIWPPDIPWHGIVAFRQPYDLLAGSENQAGSRVETRMMFAEGRDSDRVSTARATLGFDFDRVDPAAVLDQQIDFGATMPTPVEECRLRGGSLARAARRLKRRGRSVEDCWPERPPDRPTRPLARARPVDPEPFRPKRNLPNRGRRLDLQGFPISTAGLPIAGSRSRRSVLECDRGRLVA